MDAMTIDAALRAFYAKRGEGDLDACLGFFRDDAVVQYAGSPEASPFARTVEGIDALRVVFHDFIGLWIWERFELASITVDGDRAAVHIIADIRFSLGEQTFTTDMLDLWTFDDAGRAVRLVEFVDTAMVQKLVGA